MPTVAETMRELSQRIREEIGAHNYDVSDDEYIAIVHKIVEQPRKKVKK